MHPEISLTSKESSCAGTRCSFSILGSLGIGHLSQWRGDISFSIESSNVCRRRSIVHRRRQRDIATRCTIALRGCGFILKLRSCWIQIRGACSWISLGCTTRCSRLRATMRWRRHLAFPVLMMIEFSFVVEGKSRVGMKIERSERREI